MYSKIATESSLHLTSDSSPTVAKNIINPPFGFRPLCHYVLLLLVSGSVDFSTKSIPFLLSSKLDFGSRMKDSDQVSNGTRRKLFGTPRLVSLGRELGQTFFTKRFRYLKMEVGILSFFMLYGWLRPRDMGNFTPPKKQPNIRYLEDHPS